MPCSAAPDEGVRKEADDEEPRVGATGLRTRLADRHRHAAGQGLPPHLGRRVAGGEPVFALEAGPGRVIGQGSLTAATPGGSETER